MARTTDFAILFFLPSPHALKICGRFRFYSGRADQDWRYANDAKDQQFPQALLLHGCASLKMMVVEMSDYSIAPVNQHDREFI
jgi:hypothetical protein